MKLPVNDLLLYFGLMFLLPLTLAGHKLHLTLPVGSFFHLLVFLTLIGGSPTTTGSPPTRTNTTPCSCCWFTGWLPAPSVSASDFTNYSNGGSAP